MTNQQSFSSNKEIAKLLRHVAAAYTIRDEQKYRFQIIAYQRAADSIEYLTTELKDLARDGLHEKIPGIGSAITGYLEELFTTGRVKHFENVIKKVPQAVFPLLDVPGFGPKKAYKIVQSFTLKSPETVIDDIEQLAQAGKIAPLPTFGEKSQLDILKAIQEYKLGKTKSNRMTLPYAFELAKKMVDYLQQSKDVIEAHPLGSLRRMVATVGDIDIAVSSHNAAAVIKHFVAYRQKERVIEEGNTTASLLVNGGRQIDLMIQKPESFGSLLQHFTGSKHHNVALREYALRKHMSLSEYGIKVKKGRKDILHAFKTEKQFYNYIGLDWIPPELREDQGEIELAQRHKLPQLLEVSDIKGDLHTHSNYPIEPSHDLGKNSLEEMIQKAISLKYAYIGFSEHNPSVNNHTKDQIYSILSRRKEKIEQLKKSNKNIRIINLLEVDILASGELAIDDKSMELIDAALVSIHSSFSLDEEEMTRRVLTGLSHPKAKILCHPTGRLLNEREGYDLDWEKVFSYVKEHGKALEINAWPTRLDPPDNLVREAAHHGVQFVVNTDSHAAWQMDHMMYGVAVARRGWLQKGDILNTLGYNELIKWFTTKD